MRIILSSAGRRVYLVKWFQSALSEAGILGEVIVAENNPNAAAVAASDLYWKMPKYTDDSYHSELLKMVRTLNPDLFISLNDHEINLLSKGWAKDLRELGVCVPVLDAPMQQMVFDKYEMSQKLSSLGLETPNTALLSDFDSVSEFIIKNDVLIVKDRFGSGSSGLLRMSSTKARKWFDSIIREGIDVKELENLVIQPCISGDEFGVDIVTPLDGGAVLGVFARKKLAMRHGETSAAVTVPPDSFIEIANRISSILDSKGTIDVDILVQGDKKSVVDINPRFGGGYPFVHLAGVDTPSFIVRSLANRPIKDSWNEYATDYRAAKHEGVISFHEGDTPDQTRPFAIL